MEPGDILVAIYEDNLKLRDLICMLIDNASGFSVVGAYSNCSNILSEIRTNRPDVILMDIEMPDSDGIEGIKRVKEYDVKIKVLMHTVFDDDERLFICLANGADGYLLKKDSSIHLIQYLKEVFDGGGPMSPGIARRVLKSFHNSPKATESYFNITPREQQILQLLAKGYTYRMIGIELNISVETVRKHLKNIYQKLHVQCGTEAVAKAIKESIIKI
jgi:DNA-binding NarL/FixJ family response regulator